MIQKNKYGYYEIQEKPSLEELSEYYNKKYYQVEDHAYQHNYSEAEIQFFHNKIAQKYLAIKDKLEKKDSYTLLDVGCGEGFCLKHFKELGWNVAGCDFSDFGIKAHNPDCAQYMLVGDIYEHLSILVKAGKSFDLIWLDNVLEHVLTPLELLSMCKELSTPNGILIIEVPNDFSVLQDLLLKNNFINSQFWVVVPDHVSYFNKVGLASICEEAGWTAFRFLSDFPIDFNLVNPEANYILDRAKGKAAHQQRVMLDNLIHQISPEGANKLYEAFADLGLGRQIIGIFTNERSSD